MSNFCSYCGAENQDGAQFCSKCGKHTASSPAPSRQAAESAPQNVTVVLRNENKTPIFSSFGICCGILGIFTLGFIFIPLGMLFTLIGLLRGEFLVGTIAIVVNVIGFFTSPVLMALIGFGVLAGVGMTKSPSPNSERYPARVETTVPKSSILEKESSADQVAPPKKEEQKEEIYQGKKPEIYEQETRRAGASAPQNFPSTELKQSGATVFQNPNLQAMLDGAAASDEMAITAGFQGLQAQVKPERGDRQTARKLNTEGLAKFNAGIFNEALELFDTARKLDKSDVELVNNYAFAALKTGNVALAIPALEQALLLAPERTAAWSNLFEALAIRGAPDASIRGAMGNVLRFAKNQEKTRQFLEQRIESEPDKTVQDRLRNAYASLKKA